MIPHDELSDNNKPTHNDVSETGQDLAPADQAFWESLTLQMTSTEQCFSDETVEALQRICPPEELTIDEMARFEDIFQRATSDLEFEAAVKAGTRRATLGEYLFFLRHRAGHSVAEAAHEADLDFQTLTELEQDTIRPQRIAPHPLATLVRWLNGSLVQLERLLLTAVRAPRYLYSNDRGSLYRSPHGGKRFAIEPASLSASGQAGQQTENPEYTSEVEVVRRLVRDVRAAWSNAASSQDSE